MPKEQDPLRKPRSPRGRKPKADAAQPQREWPQELVANEHFQRMPPLWKQFYEAVRKGALDE
jgi:hypothetical protein